ncbi:MAG: hypothetical protein DMG57_10595 [Acidobacteria bacterium]|nr:MAG: hypothetical protein DMG57_10595 [Acidobacteriota bacterium]
MLTSDADKQSSAKYGGHARQNDFDQSSCAVLHTEPLGDSTSAAGLVEIFKDGERGLKLLF